MMDSYDHLLNSLNFTAFGANFTIPNEWDINFMDTLELSDMQFRLGVFMYYLNGVCGMIICVLGMIGNILSVIVLSQRVMSSSTYSYLSALAMSDTVFLFFTMLLLLKDTDKPLKDGTAWQDPVYYIKMFPIVHPAAVTFQVTSIWLTLAFTVDRYIMICHPFSAERWCSISRARKTIVFLIILSVLYNIPRFLEYEVIEEEIPPMLNITFPSIVKYRLTKLGSSELFRELNHSWLYLICVAGLPFISLAVLNTFLMFAVFASRKKGIQLNAKERRRNDTTVMLIGVIVIFLVCQGPALVSRMVWALNVNVYTTSLSWNIFSEISNFLVLLNSAINIVPYYFFGKKFRRQFWRLFCKCLLTKEEIRKLARSLSLTMDRRGSNMSQVPEQELKALAQKENYNSIKQHKKKSIDIPLIRQGTFSDELALPNVYLNQNPSSFSSTDSTEPACVETGEMELTAKVDHTQKVTISDHTVELSNVDHKIDLTKTDHKSTLVNLEPNGNCIDYAVLLQQCHARDSVDH